MPHGAARVNSLRAAVEHIDIGYNIDIHAKVTLVGCSIDAHAARGRSTDAATFSPMGTKSFVCQQCGKVFECASDLRRHLADVRMSKRGRGKGGNPAKDKAHFECESAEPALRCDADVTIIGVPLLDGCQAGSLVAAV